MRRCTYVPSLHITLLLQQTEEALETNSHGPLRSDQKCKENSIMPEAELPNEAAPAPGAAVGMEMEAPSVDLKQGVVSGSGFISGSSFGADSCADVEIDIAAADDSDMLDSVMLLWRHTVVQYKEVSLQLQYSHPTLRAELETYARMVGPELTARMMYVVT